jgi:hypothetical protein
MSPAILAFLELTTPAMLGGLVLLSLPIAAHLLNRQARRQIVFPTLQLLRASTAMQSRLFRLRRWILLCLRCLAVALIALAFARPVWLDARTKSALPGKGAGVGVVIVIDVSASTTQQHDGVSLIHELRAAAIRTLDALSDGTDVANVVLASSRPQSLFPKLSPNLPALREELSRVGATNERADLQRAIGLAGESLAAHNGPRRLVILSDLQRSNWQEVVGGSQIASLLPPDTNVTVIDVPAPVSDNVALSSPRHYPAQPLAGQPIQLVVQFNNYSRVAKEVRLSITVDGRPQPSQTIALSPEEQRDVAVESVLKEPGEHEVTFEIPADGLAADNRAFLVVKMRERLPVVIVSDDRPNDPGTASYFLSRALAPSNDARLDHFEVRSVSSAQLTDASLADASAVFVGYLGELSPAAAGTLVKYVRGGGGVLFFSGEGPVRQNLQTLQRAAGDVGILPWEPGPGRTLGTPDRCLTITNGKWGSRLLREFDEQSQIVISQIRFTRVWSAGPPAADATILLTFNDGTSALGVRPVGAGQFLLASFSPALVASDLGKYGSFVAVVQTLAGQLSPGASAGAAPAVVGEPYRYPEPFRLGTGAAGARPGANRIAVIGPGKEPISIATNVESDRVTVQLQRTLTPGFYRFQLGEKTIASIAVNIDKRESDLERIERDSLLRCFGIDAPRLTVQGADDWEPLGKLRGRPLWGWCLGVALAAFGIELICLGYWRR